MRPALVDWLRFSQDARGGQPESIQAEISRKRQRFDRPTRMAAGRCPLDSSRQSVRTETARTLATSEAVRSEGCPTGAGTAADIDEEGANSSDMMRPNKKTTNAGRPWSSVGSAMILSTRIDIARNFLRICLKSRRRGARMVSRTSASFGHGHSLNTAGCLWFGWLRN